MKTFITVMARFKLWLVFEGLYQDYSKASPKKRRDLIQRVYGQNIPYK